MLLNKGINKSRFQFNLGLTLIGPPTTGPGTIATAYGGNKISQYELA